MGNWSELLPEIIHMISVRVDNPFDLIHFRSVCSWWRSFSLPKFRPIPSLRCSLPPDAGACGDDCHILRSRVYLIKSLSRVPHPFWLFKLQEEENGELALQCLFNRKTSSEWGCSYPSLSLDLLNSQVIELAQEHVACYTSWCDLFDEGFACKGEGHISFMQLDAGNKEFMILGRLSFQGLGMYRSFEKRWTEITTPPGPFPEAMASFKGKFYANYHTGVMKVVKPSLEVNSFQWSRPCDMTRKRWLVKSEDKLLLVEICTDNRKEYLTPTLLEEKGVRDFRVRREEKRLDSSGGCGWSHLDILFLDYHCSLSCLPTQIQGFRPNSIIFNSILGYTGDRQFQVFEFGVQGIRYFGDISEYIQLFPSPYSMIDHHK